MIRYSQIIFTRKTEESQIFYTLTQGAKNCKFLVKRELKAIDSQPSIIFKVSFINKCTQHEYSFFRQSYNVEEIKVGLLK